MRVETRQLAIPATLCSEDDPARPARLVGYAARFSVESDPLSDPDVNGGRPFVEVLAPGVFARTLREQPDIRALYNHETSYVLGRTKSGTLRLVEDAQGLRFEVDLPDTTIGRDVRAMVSRGDIDGCSFGFAALKDRWEKRAGSPPLRTILDLELYEISPAVAFPAYGATEVSVRSLARQADRSTCPALAIALRSYLLHA